MMMPPTIPVSSIQTLVLCQLPRLWVSTISYCPHAQVVLISLKESQEQGQWIEVERKIRQIHEKYECFIEKTSDQQKLG